MEGSRTELLLGDITQLKADAIVSAANSRLLGGSGVDGAIHAAAGPELLQECLTIGGCPTGEAKLTKGYRLPATFIIHAVGPIWKGGIANEPELLRGAYLSALRIALHHKLSLVAFPCIGTGIYGYPLDKAARIACRTVQKFLQKNDFPQKVIFVCFNAENYEVYRRTMEGYLP